MRLKPTYLGKAATSIGFSWKVHEVERDQLTLELICKSGHKSEHPKERVLRRNDAWCPKCGADVKHDPGKDAGALSKAA